MQNDRLEPNDIPQGRGRKGSGPGRYRFLTERIAPREVYCNLSQNKADALRLELEHYKGSSIPRPEGTPLEQVRHLFLDFSDYNLEILQDSRGRLHFRADIQIASLCDFCGLPIAFTYRMGTFGEAVRGILRTIVKRYRFADIRYTPHFDWLKDSRENMLDEASDMGYDHEDIALSRRIIRYCNNLTEGRAGKHLDEFWNSEGITFEEFRKHKPRKPDHLELYNFLLDAESHMNRPANELWISEKDEDTDNTELVYMDSGVFVDWDNNYEFCEDFTEYVNSDLSSGMEEDILSVSVMMDGKHKDNSKDIARDYEYLKSLFYNFNRRQQ